MDDPNALFEKLLEDIDSQRYPPVADWHPERQGHSKMRIDRNGDWYHEGSRIARPQMVHLFSTILRRDPDGYVLVTPAERLLIDVEDVPFVAVDFEVRQSVTVESSVKEPAAGITMTSTPTSWRSTDLLFVTNVGDLVLVDAGHPIFLREAVPGAPYVRVRAALDARVSRAAYYRLIEHAREENGRVWIDSAGVRFELGRV